VRILIFHGYLLSGTGSNVYTAHTARALTALGHDVHLLCQDRHPERQPFVDAVGDWESGTLVVRELDAGDWGSRGAGEGRSRGGRCTVYRPDIGDLLPVYVADTYEGIRARTFADCSDGEIAGYLDANVAAAAELGALVAPQAALANHLIMGPVIVARALRGEVPYAVKIHGSALEYTVKPQPERFLDFAREGVAGAAAVLVGSLHTAKSLWDALEDDGLRARTRLGPPGVDVHRFGPREPAAARAGVRALSARLREQAARQAPPSASGPTGQPAGAGASTKFCAHTSSFARDELAAARALERVEGERDRLVAFVGKLIVSKGVDLLLAAWPLVLSAAPDARLVVVGFGAYRATLERLLAALAAGELERAREIARAGSSLEGAVGEALAPGERQPEQERALGYLLAFLDGLHGEAGERYVESARALPERVLWTGRLEYEEVAELLPACEALIVPSTFPESFGMVAAEAAACGALPISAAHSGLAEVSTVLAAALPAPVASWLSFPLGAGAVAGLAQRLVAWLSADEELRAQARADMVATVRERWSWEGVARGVIAAARGELDVLAAP